MKLMRINTRIIHYALYKGEGDPILDKDGFETGEREILYSDPIKLRCNVAPPEKGASLTDVFGVLEDYDRIIITDDMSCPIDEYSVLWVDSLPDGNTPHDYTVWRVAKYLTHIAYAVRKVKVKHVT